MLIGTVAEILRYPVKSMGGESLHDAPVSHTGIAGDRAYALFDPLERKVASAKHTRAFPRILDFRAESLPEGEASAAPIRITLPDGRSVRSDDPGCVELLSAWFGRPVGLGRLSDEESQRPIAGKYAMAGTFFDYAPMHVITRVALEAAALAAPRSQFAARRFRPNIVIASSSGASYPENDWVGKRLRIGEQILLEITDPCPRCVLPTMAQGDLPSDPEILKTLARQNTVYAPVLESDQPCIGAYAFVRRGGPLKVGDAVKLEG